MRVHVPQEQEERLFPLDKTIKFRDCDLVEVLCFRAGPFFPTSPTRIGQVVIKSTRTGVAAETNTGCLVTDLSKDFGEGFDFGSEGTLVS